MVLTEITSGLDLNSNQVSFLAAIIISVLFFFQYKKYEEEEKKEEMIDQFLCN
jgi:hypothetical protein